MSVPGAVPDGLRVVVLSGGDLGVEVAKGLVGLSGVSAVSLAIAPGRRRVPTLGRRIRLAWRMQGPWALVSSVPRRVLGLGRKAAAPAAPLTPPDGVAFGTFVDFHDDDCLDWLRGQRPDLGVVAGTGILKERVFGVPRLGSINLHSGKAPEYRGAAPAFWELFNGASHVGITIHRVTAQLDSGHVLRQELFPLDPAPEGDPLEYLARYRREVLRPNGVRLLVETVAAIAAGTAVDQPQDASGARTYRTPDHRSIRELRRRVRNRRAGVAQ
jgi:folate-dependent phosphoribosylglycinamide formyltransferase PurN